MRILNVLLFVVAVVYIVLFGGGAALNGLSTTVKNRWVGLVQIAFIFLVLLRLVILLCQ